MRTWEVLVGMEGSGGGSPMSRASADGRGVCYVPELEGRGKYRTIGVNQRAHCLAEEEQGGWAAWSTCM